MDLELKDYLAIIRKRLLMIIAIAVVASSTTAIYSYYFVDPVYQASTKLIVNKKNELADQLDINSVNLNLRLIDTYKEIIKTTAIMDKVTAEHPEFSMTSEQLIEKIKVSSVNNTQVMTLSVRDGDYEKAVHVVNAVAKVFVEEIPSLMSVDNVSILNSAKMDHPPAPVAPNPELNIAICLIVSLMLGVGIAFLLEYLDDTIKTEQDVREVLGLPTIAMIPKVKRADMDKASLQVKETAGGKTHAPIS